MKTEDYWKQFADERERQKILLSRPGLFQRSNEEILREGKMRDFLMLYGVKVPSNKRDELKQVADVLAKQTYTNVSLRQARRMAVLFALEGFKGMIEWSRKQQYESMRQLTNLKGGK